MIRGSGQVERTRHAVKLFQTGELKSIGHKVKNAPRPPDLPPRDASHSRNPMGSVKGGKRKTNGATLHALANIEQYA